MSPLCWYNISDRQQQCSVVQKTTFEIILVFFSDNIVSNDREMDICWILWVDTFSSGFAAEIQDTYVVCARKTSRPRAAETRRPPARAPSPGGSPPDRDRDRLRCPPPCPRRRWSWGGWTPGQGRAGWRSSARPAETPSRRQRRRATAGTGWTPAPGWSPLTQRKYFYTTVRKYLTTGKYLLPVSAEWGWSLRWWDDVSTEDIHRIAQAAAALLWGNYCKISSDILCDKSQGDADINKYA